MIQGFTGFERIGEGGQAEVFRALDAGGRAVAVKVLRAEHARDAGAARRFEREGRVHRDLSHPLIPRALAVAVTRDGRPALVLELVRGRDLRALLARGATPWRDAVAVGVGVARALDHAHARAVIHRDVKPSNVMLADGEDPPDAVRVLDFGVALAADRTRITRSSRVGSDSYVAPEQRAGAATPASDLYSLGVTLLHLATGRLPARVLSHDPAHDPARDTPVRDVWPDAPPQLDRLLRAMTEPDPGRRPASAREVEAALLAVDAPAEADAAAPLRRAVEQARGRELALRAERAELELLAREAEEAPLSREDAARLHHLRGSEAERERVLRDLAPRLASLHAALAALAARRG